jgi:hypothetical protein
LMFLPLDFRSPAILSLFPAHAVREPANDFLAHISFFSSHEGASV